MFCTKCGNPISEDFIFCPYCQNKVYKANIPIENQTIVKIPPVKKEKHRSKSNMKWHKTCIFFALFFLVFFFSLHLINSLLRHAYSFIINISFDEKNIEEYITYRIDLIEEELNSIDSKDEYDEDTADKLELAEELKTCLDEIQEIPGINDVKSTDLASETIITRACLLTLISLFRESAFYIIGIILCIKARSKLAKFKEGAPKFFILTMIYSAIVFVTKGIIFKFITSYIHISPFGQVMVGEFALLFFGMYICSSALVILLNYLYYRKRDHLFVN